jgi:membrane-associated phospholipid phosphatase
MRKTKIADRLFGEITVFGGVIFFILVIGFSFVFGGTETATKLLIGLVSIYFITVLIRLVYFKERPNKRNYSNFIEKIDACSFPSVHAARSVFLYMFFVLRFNLDFFVVGALSILLLAVLYSRVYLRKHDVIDVLAGTVLGIVCYILIF